MWVKSAFDGHKFVCADDFSSVIYNEGCLVYSFGLSTDTSFEEAMAEAGCEVQCISTQFTHWYSNNKIL